MNNNNFLSYDGFDKWLKKNSINENEKKTSEKVYSKIKFSSLINKIEVDDGNIFEIAKCFRKNGGTIIESVNNILTIKTKKGIFSIEENDTKYKSY